MCLNVDICIPWKSKPTKCCLIGKDKSDMPMHVIFPLEWSYSRAQYTAMHALVDAFVWQDLNFISITADRAGAHISNNVIITSDTMQSISRWMIDAETRYPQTVRENGEPEEFLASGRSVGRSIGGRDHIRMTKTKTTCSLGRGLI